MKKINLAILLLLMTVLLLGCGEKAPWSESDLARMIPLPVSSVRTVLVDEETQFSVDVGSTSPKLFHDYVSFCDAVGFRKKAKSDELSYTAYHENGAFLTLTYSAEQSRMRIELVSKKHKNFGLSLIGDISERLEGLVEQMKSTSDEVTALPVYKTSVAGGVVSAVETVEIRRVIYRLSPELEAYSAELALCNEHYAELEPNDFDIEVLDAYRHLGMSLEQQGDALMQLIDSVYDLQNAVDSLDRQVSAGGDLASLEQTLLALSPELDRIAGALDNPAFTVTVSEPDEDGVSLASIDADAYWAQLCLAVPALEDVGVLLEKSENLLLLLCEDCVSQEESRGRYAAAETQLLAFRKSYCLMEESARKFEDVFERYRKNLPPDMGGEDVQDTEPSFPTLERPLENVAEQTVEFLTQIETIIGDVEAGKPLSQPMVEKIRSDLFELQEELSDCTEEAIKLRRAGKCYPNTSPSSRPVFDGLEQQITELRATINEQMTTLEQLSRSQDMQTLAGIENELKDIELNAKASEEKSQQLLETIRAARDDATLSVSQSVRTAANLVTEIGTLQNQLRVCLNDLITVKNRSLDDVEIAHATELEMFLYQINTDLVSLRESVQSIQKTLELLEKARA